jgi:hypothetical protein
MASKNHYSIGYYQRQTTTANWRSLKNNTWNQWKENYATTSHQRLRQKRIEFGWMDGSSSMERTMWEHKKIILFRFITCKDVKYLRKNILKEGTMVWPQWGIYGVKCIWYDPKGGIYGVKCIWYDPKGGTYGVKCTCNL